MQADFSVELGADDDRLELPWASPEGELRYYDLKRRPELLLHISEAHHNRELAEFLTALNSAASIFETAKCDTWLSNELSEEEQVFGASWKFGSYVDLVFTESGTRLSFDEHEKLADDIAKLLHRAPDISAAAEFIVRRCFYHLNEGSPEPDVGYCITFYLHGYGDDEDDSRRRWGIAMKVVENALLQLSGQRRRKTVNPL
jgi:hypothetical protein